MNRIKIDFVRKVGAPQWPRVVVDDAHGKQWVHKIKFRFDDPRIPRLIKKIDEVGSIDPQHWTPATKVY